MIMHDGTTAFYQEFAIMTSPTLIGEFSATNNSGTIEVKLTPEQGISGTTTCRYTKNLLAGI